MSGLPDKISINDEFYGFEANPRSAVKVLFRADETSYVPGPSAMGDHPAAWAHEYDGGRAVYTTMGHFSSTYADPSFKKFLTNAILWSAHQEATTKIYFSQTKNIQVHSGLFQFDLTGRLRETRPNYFSLY